MPLPPTVSITAPWSAFSERRPSSVWSAAAKRVPAERVAAAGIVDDVPAAAAAKILSGGVFAVTDRTRSRDENAPRRLHRACERDLMVAAEKELSGKAVRSKLRAQYFPIAAPDAPAPPTHSAPHARISPQSVRISPRGAGSRPRRWRKG